MTDFILIEPQQLKSMLHDGDEIAVLDAREEGDFASSHLLMASSVPLSQLEFLLADRVPRRDARVVWMDAGDGFAEVAAERASAFGYGSVFVLDGGVEAWRMAGFQVYTGVHVPSKAFAEVIEHDCETPWISAQTLDSMRRTDTDMVILDSRSFEEFHSNSIPDAVSCPGAELVYRIRDMVPSVDTTVVVNCGGRTRSIIGAQSLINAGLPNRVMSLRDGTMAWHLAGLDVRHGCEDSPPAASDAGLAWAGEAAQAVADKFEVTRIDEATLAGWREDASRTTVVIDVRTPQEYARSHLAGARSVPGGQLVQETDRHLGVWGSRVVLTDEDGIRATMTASWLKQMGWDAFVLVPSAQAARDVGHYQPQRLSVTASDAQSVPAAALRDIIEAEPDAPSRVTVIDIDTSERYDQGHIPGAWFATRARLELGQIDLSNEAIANPLVITSADGVAAELAANAMVGQGHDVQWLEGGTGAWTEAGYALESGMYRLAAPANDLWHTPRRRDPARREAAMREYLTWETALVYQIKNDDDCRYRDYG
jgi:rhodanese-related sulfurtransferase